MEQEDNLNQSFQQRSLNKFQAKNQKKKMKKQKKYGGRKGGQFIPVINQDQKDGQNQEGDMQENMDEEETLSFKEKQKINLLKQLHELSILQKDAFNIGLIKLFKEHNRDQMKRICDRFEIQELISFAEQAIQLTLDGKAKKEDNEQQQPRTLGGTYMKIIKDYLDKEDPMKLKDVFQRSDDQKRKKNQNTKRRRQALKQNLGSNINNGQKAQNIFEAFNN